ncbi:MAG TPA: thermonuclease family protein, partial [Castellaniella sp.]|nr:thermonuclease family protein [Castellaniella sp.]
MKRRLRSKLGPWLLVISMLAGLGATAFGLSVPALPGADTYALTGRVVDVSDGDTLGLLVGSVRKRIRLASIDAPETSHGKNRPGQPFGQASRKALAEW